MVTVRIPESGSGTKAAGYFHGNIQGPPHLRVTREPLGKKILWVMWLSFVMLCTLFCFLWFFRLFRLLFHIIMYIPIRCNVFYSYIFFKFAFNFLNKRCLHLYIGTYIYTIETLLSLC